MLKILRIGKTLIITNKVDIDNFKITMGNEFQFGIDIEYGMQLVQHGILIVLTIVNKCIGDEEVDLILGDSIFHANDID